MSSIESENTDALPSPSPSPSLTVTNDKKPKKPKKPINWAQHTDFPERQREEFKPKPLPEGTTFKSLVANIRAESARVTYEQTVKLYRECAPVGVWGNALLEPLYQSQEVLKEQARKYSVEAEKAAATAAAKLEKKKEFAAIKADLTEAMMTGVAKIASENLSAVDGYGDGLVAALEAFRKHAPKIKTWTPTAIDLAIKLAASVGLRVDEARKIINEAAAEPEPVQSKCGKRKAAAPSDAEASDSVDTPTKAKRADAKDNGSGSNLDSNSDLNSDSSSVNDDADVTNIFGEEDGNNKCMWEKE